MKENNWTDPDMANNTDKDKEDQQQPHTLVIPDTSEFQTLRLIRKLFNETIDTIDLLLHKCTYNTAKIHSQINNNKVKRSTDDYQKLLEDTKKLITARFDASLT